MLTLLVISIHVSDPKIMKFVSWYHVSRADTQKRITQTSVDVVK